MSRRRCNPASSGRNRAARAQGVDKLTGRGPVSADSRGNHHRRFPTKHGGEDPETRAPRHSRPNGGHEMKAEQEQVMKGNGMTPTGVDRFENIGGLETHYLDYPGP